MDAISQQLLFINYKARYSEVMLFQDLTVQANGILKRN